MNCGKVILDNARFNQNCGAMTAVRVYCSHCGQMTEPFNGRPVRFCPNCGSSELTAAPLPKTEKVYCHAEASANQQQTAKSFDSYIEAHKSIDQPSERKVDTAGPAAGTLSRHYGSESSADKFALAMEYVSRDELPTELYRKCYRMDDGTIRISCYTYWREGDKILRRTVDLAGARGRMDDGAAVATVEADGTITLLEKQRQSPNHTRSDAGKTHQKRN